MKRVLLLNLNRVFVTLLIVIAVLALDTYVMHNVVPSTFYFVLGMGLAILYPPVYFKYYLD